MKNVLIESIPRDDLRNATHIDVEVSYRRDSIIRGYYLIVQPVTHKNGMSSYELLSGKSMLLMKTNRFSQKQMSQAVELGKANMQQLIVEVLAQECVA